MEQANDGSIIRTERLVLRPHRFEDLDDVLAYATDETWSRYLPVPQPYTRDDGVQFLASCVLTDWDVNPRWAMEHDGRCSGGINLRLAGDNVAEIGYSLAPWLWGQGVTAEAVAGVLDWAFPNLDLVRVMATVDPENRQSWRVMEKLGMTREGHLRSARTVRGQRRDDYVYGLLRTEWETQRQTRQG